MATKKNVKPSLLAGNILAGIEKFISFAASRGINMVDNTYGIYRVVCKGKASTREAAKAYKVNRDGSVTFGWIINLANRERVFKPDGGDCQVYVQANI